MTGRLARSAVCGINVPVLAQARCNHTATHLLQAALKQVLGDDISQAGSLVDFERLRFDFNAPEAPSPAQLARVEKLVNGACMRRVLPVRA